MRIRRTTQPGGGPEWKPLVKTPVVVTLDVLVFYCTERGPVPSLRGIMCGKVFAATVLTEMNRILGGYGFALVHIGVYVPRRARKADGTLIRPARWSNHAYGEAMDFKGIITERGEGKFLDIAAMKRGCPKKLREILEACESAICARNRRPEIVDEGGWIHIGLWPE